MSSNATTLPTYIKNQEHVLPSCYSQSVSRILRKNHDILTKRVKLLYDTITKKSIQYASYVNNKTCITTNVALPKCCEATEYPDDIFVSACHFVVRLPVHMVSCVSATKNQPVNST